MPFVMTPNVHVRRDRSGHVRQLSHVSEPYRPNAVDMAVAGLSDQALTPRSLAEQYLREVAPLYDLAPTTTANFAADVTAAPSAAPSELRFKEEKSVGDVAAIAYDQTYRGLPIWDAGMTVRIHTAPMQVTGSSSAVHYGVQATPPDPGAPFMPHSLDAAKLRQILGVGGDAGPRLNATRLVIYWYDPARRIDPQVAAHRDNSESTGLSGKATPDFPVLSLPPVDARVLPSRHYVVTEVLFTLAYGTWGPLHWRAFVEPATGSVLYLRALVSCARGSVFLTDPVTASGVLHEAAEAATVLDPLRTTVAVVGLATVPTGQKQPLRGEYVALVDVDGPGTPMPAEAAPFDFLYSCKTDNFAACSAYHHCDGVFRMIESMGIPVASYFNNTDFPVPVDPHALHGQVNAQARGNVMGNGMGAFVFGVASSGQPLGIAADVRVVLHEFGHALLWDHVSSPNFGFAHSAGDSLAAILHDPDSKAPDRFETFPFMQTSAGLSRRHDRQVAAGWGWGGPNDDTQYGSEQILSTTLFRIYQAAGGDSTNLVERRAASRYVVYLIIKAIGLLSFTTEDPDVYVSALIDTDATTATFQGYPGGTLGKVIRWSFEQQNLYAGAPPEVDVYIDDGRAGAYMPYLQDFRGNAEIWNRQSADGAAAHQAPRIGLPNHAYVAVKNHGAAPATAVRVRAFQARSATAAVWPTDWKPVTTPVIATPGALAPGGRVVVGPFEWTPEFEGARLLVSVTADGDVSHLDGIATPTSNSRLVPVDNNIAERVM
jgi:zinc metalloprotease ZmpB